MFDFNKWGLKWTNMKPFINLSKKKNWKKNKKNIWTMIIFNETDKTFGRGTFAQISYKIYDFQFFMKTKQQKAFSHGELMHNFWKCLKKKFAKKVNIEC